MQDEWLEEVLEMTRAGKSSRSIATALDLSQSAVSRMQRKARQQGLLELNKGRHEGARTAPQT
ncbi:MAG: hypothetical protein DMG86_04275 [Acidobacteria bacterium]|nr:MAG: hypothetical protein DMG86_04275 [Acidobacteriota bacterium]PYX05630.1 MAG: hypothetical protein DMG85_14975 [Acidobacteriota bacterium]PYX14195.1 MAG: hypothetical protein DMG84_16215 [Acidobacteriota bacterium]